MKLGFRGILGFDVVEDLIDERTHGNCLL